MNHLDMMSRAAPHWIGRMRTPIPTWSGSFAPILPAKQTLGFFPTPSRHPRLVQVLLHHSRFLLTESRTRSISGP